MRLTAVLLTAAAFLLPLTASAAWWDDLVNSAVNGTQVESYTSAASNTGGNSAGSGGTVTTGDSSVSAHSETIVNGGSGSVDIQVETNSNGAASSETFHKDFSAGEGVSVDIATSSGQGSTSARVKIDVNAHDESGVATTSGTGDENASGTTLAFPPMHIPSFVSRFLQSFTSWFSFF